MAKEQKSKYGVIQTKNSFKMKGIVFGEKGKNFYAEDKNKRTISFGININKDKPLYCRLQGFTKKDVYYSNNDKTNPQTIQVSWANRMKAPKTGFEVIGVKIGLEIDENGKNITKSMTEYDAAHYLSEHLHDGDSVTIIGEMEYYVGSDGSTKTNYVPKQIYLEREAIDFSSDNFTEKALFAQTLVFTDLEKETDPNGKQTGRILMHGYDVAYQNICKVDYVLAGSPLKNAGAIKKKVKEFNALNISGCINVSNGVVELESSSDEDWGKPNELTQKRVNSPVVTEFVVDYIDPNNIDTEKYDEESITTAIRQIKSDREARKNFGDKPKTNTNVEADNTDWGNDSFGDDNETIEW